MDTFTTPPPKCTVVELSVPAEHVLLVTINRERSMNAVDMDGHWECEALWTWFDAEPTLRVAVITGKGTKAFSAGQDLASTMKKGPGAGGFPPGGFLGLSQREGKKPVVAAVNGYALGGGFEVALNCDLVVASPKATFGLTEVKRGLFAAAGGLPRAVRIFGLQMASEIALTGRLLTAHELQAQGFLRVASSPQSLLTEAVRLASDVAAQSPDAVIVTRAGLRQAWETASVRRAGEITNESGMSRLVQGDNLRIGLEAFANKEKPVWVPSKL